MDGPAQRGTTVGLFRRLARPRSNRLIILQIADVLIEAASLNRIILLRSRVRGDRRRIQFLGGLTRL
jgi:hypothetical protein